MQTTFTQETARVFETGYSEINALIVEMAPCTCKAYEDIFTYNRWQALGFQVRKGEKATKIKTWKRIKKTDDKTGKDKSFSIPRTSNVFCRCQVDEIGAEPAPVSVPETKEKPAEKIKAVKFHVTRSESGLVPDGGLEFATWQETHDFMQTIAQEEADQYGISEISAYCKTWVSIFFEDGEGYEDARCDIHGHALTGDRDLGTHIWEHCAFYAGDFQPKHMTDAEYAPYKPGGNLHVSDFVEFMNKYEIAKIKPAILQGEKNV